MARQATIIGSMIDIDGGDWDVRERRATKHGWDLMFGWPAGLRGPGCGGPRLIPTPELLEYWRALPLNRTGAIYDLPASRNTIKRVRRLFGLNYYVANEGWWLERLPDLADWPGERFARVHGVSEHMVSIMHSRLIGRRIRGEGWWREESNAALLNSDLPRAYVADRLTISVGAVGRLRWMLRKAVGTEEIQEKGIY